MSDIRVGQHALSLMPITLFGTSPRSHLQHGNYNAPIEDNFINGIKALDVGCGSGRWTIDMAEDYPASHFTGIDIVTDILPKTGYPENCTFLRANTLKGLPFEDNTFDFVFQRYVHFYFV